MGTCKYQVKCIQPIILQTRRAPAITVGALYDVIDTNPNELKFSIEDDIGNIYTFPAFGASDEMISTKDYFELVIQDENERELYRLRNLLHKHGICDRCGEMYSHHIEEPFASCGCGTSEWGTNLTPYMELEKQVFIHNKSHPLFICEGKPDIKYRYLGICCTPAGELRRAGEEGDQHIYYQDVGTLAIFKRTAHDFLLRMRKV